MKDTAVTTELYIATALKAISKCERRLTRFGKSSQKRELGCQGELAGMKQHTININENKSQYLGQIRQVFLSDAPADPRKES